MDILWTVLALAFWFVLAFAALLWLASRLYGNDGPRGPVLPLAIALIAGFIAYAAVIHAPPQQECVEQQPNGAGRC